MTAAVRHRLADLDRRLADSPLGPSLRRDCGLAPHTTYRVGGPARLFVTVNDRAELDTLSFIVSASAAATGPHARARGGAGVQPAGRRPGLRRPSGRPRQWTGGIRDKRHDGHGLRRGPAAGPGPGLGRCRPDRASNGPWAFPGPSAERCA